jgi:hypothetical protein
VAAIGAGAVALGGCGQGNVQHTPSLAKLPLVPGARVVAQVRSCDPGANAFCAWELVVAASSYRSPEALAKAEHRYLESLGWTSANADTGQQRAQDSPGHKLRITYATPRGDLQGVELGFIKRARPIQLALSRAMFQRTSAISMLYEIGAS